MAGGIGDEDRKGGEEEEERLARLGCVFDGEGVVTSLDPGPVSCSPARAGAWAYFLVASGPGPVADTWVRTREVDMDPSCQCENVDANSVESG